MLVTFRTYINKMKLRNNIHKIIDGFYVILGSIIIVVFLLIALPFLMIDHLLSGEG